MSEHLPFHLIQHDVVVAVMKLGVTGEDVIGHYCGAGIACWGTEMSRPSSSPEAATWRGWIWNRRSPRLIVPDQEADGSARIGMPRVRIADGGCEHFHEPRLHVRFGIGDDRGQTIAEEEEGNAVMSASTGR
jgi:hypothetical protein